MLIVEDDEDALELYVWCLRAAGWMVETASDGREAVFKAPILLPDVIVMDLRLPAMSGLDASRRLKADEATTNIPIIACSAVDRVEGKVLAREVGCDEFMSKPIVPEELLNIVERLCRRRPGPAEGDLGVG